MPVAPSGAVGARATSRRSPTAANPDKKGLDVVLAAWWAASGSRRGDEREASSGCARWTRMRGSPVEPGVRFAGMLAPAEYRALLRRSRVFLSAARREDYGIAQLEALADGCLLVTTPSPGPYAALPLARALDPRLVGPELAIRTALDDPRPDYAERAAAAIAPFTPAAVDRVVAEQLLPRLLRALA